MSLNEERHGDSSDIGINSGVRAILDEKPLALRCALFLLLFAAVLALGVYGPGYDASAFIYRGF